MKTLSIRSEKKLFSLVLSIVLAVGLMPSFAWAAEGSAENAAPVLTLDEKKQPSVPSTQAGQSISISTGWYAIDSAGNKIDSSYKIEYTGQFLNPVDAVTNGKTTIKRPSFSPYLEKNKTPGTATVTIRGNTNRGYTGSFSFSFQIVPAGSLNSYGVVKADGYLHRTNATHTIDYGTVWGSNYNDATAAIREITTLYVDANVTKFDDVKAQHQSSSSPQNINLKFHGDAGYPGPRNLKKVEFLLQNGTNSCSSMASTYMFYSQLDLTEVVNFDKTQMATVPNGCFYKCSALSSIKLPATLQSIGDYAFYNCDNLKVLDVPASVKSIGTGSWTDAAIGSCDNLQKLILRSPSLVTIQRNILRDTNKNIKIYVPNSVYAKYKEQIDSNGWYRYTNDFFPNIHPFLEVSNISARSYTGKAIKPTFTVTWIGNKLKSGYVATYANNIKVGSASVTVKYSNTAVKKTFRIISWSRLWGKKALDTMEKITKQFGKASVAIIATNADYRDSLAASSLAGSLNAPMLTTAKNTLSSQTKSELKRMGVKTVYIVGSKKEVAAKVETQVKGMGIAVKRIGGSTASARAIACAERTKNRADTVIIATQNNFKDALSISSYAYASHTPILYAESNKKLSDSTLEFIRSNGFSSAIIVGGPVALPTSIEDQLRNAGVYSSNITRLAGSNEYKTSRIIAEWAAGKLSNGTGGRSNDFYQYSSIRFQPELKLSFNKLGIARADNNKIGWKDALAGAALCGKTKSVLLLADGKNSAQAISTIKTYKSSIYYGYVFGGTSAVPKGTMDKLVAASK